MRGSRPFSYRYPEKREIHASRETILLEEIMDKGIQDGVDGETDGLDHEGREESMGITSWERVRVE